MKNENVILHELKAVLLPRIFNEISEVIVELSTIIIIFSIRCL